jgi:intracellular sulfur oxidation DsrE/DsrF family protein
MILTPACAFANALVNRARSFPALALVVVTAALGPTTADAVATVDYPELGELKEIIALGRPAGMAFLVREHSEDAYDWILPRLERYIALLREHWSDLPVAVVSHGEEIFALLKERQPANAGYGEQIDRLVTLQGVTFQVCGAFAALSGFEASDFIDPVEVVDSAPYQIMDYRTMGYRVLHLELTW